MLMPLPATLRRLVKEYEALLAATPTNATTPPNQRLRDLAYTLCVSTGTREVADALERARSYLATCADTTVAPAAKCGFEERAATSSTDSPALKGTVFQHTAGELRRNSDLPSGPRPTAPPLADAAQGSGR
jgi:hypothetical protein